MANTVETNTLKCDVGTVQAAIFQQRPLIEFEVNEKLEKRPRYMIRKIRDGGAVDPHDDGRTLKMGQGFQAPVGYQSYDDPNAETCNNEHLEPGYQDAQGNCGATTARMGALINKTEQDQCNGVCVVDFAQGYSYEGSNDFELKLATPERCIETLAKKERRFVAQYLEQEVESFSETAFQSFDHHLVNLVIERGGANAVVKTHLAGLPTLTSGGWDIGNDPRNEIKHVNFWFFDHYRRQIVQRLRQYGKGESAEMYVPEFEITREAYRQMLVAEQLERSSEGGFIPGAGAQIRIDEKIFDKAHMMAKRAFAMSPDGKCRFVFEDEPIRGFLQPTGTTPAGKVTYDFIRIYHLKNVPDEEAGVRAVYNPEYDYNCITCGGVEYPLVELIPHIHNDSFVRHGLTKGIGPKGVNAAGNNFEIQLKQGADLGSGDCPNFFDNKYRYAARHHTRIRDIYPDLSGFILHRRRILAGYDIDANDECYKVTDGSACAVPEEIDNCDEERCDNGCPEVECDPALNTTSLKPCGSVVTSWSGETSQLFIEVCRDSECATEAAKVDYAITDDTAVLGTHYQPVDADGNAAPDTGTIEWLAGESGCKRICIDIIGALDDTPAVDPDGPCCEETFPTANDALFSVKIDGAVGTTLEDCDETIVGIRNRA